MAEQLVAAAAAAPALVVGPESGTVLAPFLKTAGASDTEWAALVGVIGDVKLFPDLAYISDTEFDAALGEVKLEGKPLPLTGKARLRSVKKAVTEHLQTTAGTKSI
eukprot:3353107-Amphidinium_carterae.1